MEYITLCSIWNTCKLAPIWHDALSRLIDKWLTGSTVRTRLSVETNACVPLSSFFSYNAGLAVPYNPQVQSEVLGVLDWQSDVTHQNVSPVCGCVSLSVSSLCLTYFLQLERKYGLTVRPWSYRGHFESPGRKTHYQVSFLPAFFFCDFVYCKQICALLVENFYCHS
jgi:hypothetical protein